MMVMGLMMLTTSACSNPFKVTDPSDPKFNPDKFSFNDYKTHEELRDAFRKLFPVGTDREFIERVLVNAGGAKIVDTFDFKAEGGGYLHIRYEEPFNPIRSFKQPIFYTVTLSQDNKLMNIMINGGMKVHKNKLDWWSLINSKGN